MNYNPLEYDAGLFDFDTYFVLPAGSQQVEPSGL
jgi:hypothetical protein